MYSSERLNVAIQVLNKNFFFKTQLTRLPVSLLIEAPLELPDRRAFAITNFEVSMSSIQKKVKFFFSLLIFQFVIRSVADEFTDPRDDSVDLVYERGSLTQLAWNSDLSRVALLLWSDSGEFERLREFLIKNHLQNQFTNSTMID